MAFPTVAYVVSMLIASLLGADRSFLACCRSVSYGRVLLIVMERRLKREAVNVLGSHRSSTPCGLASLTTQRRGQPFPEVKSLAWSSRMSPSDTVCDGGGVAVRREKRWHFVWCRLQQQLEFRWSHQIKGI